MSEQIIQQLNWSSQLDNTNLDKPITKQFFILFSLWCKKVTLAIKDKTLHQNMVRLNSARSAILMVIYYMKISLDIICHSLLYFAILT